MFIFILNSKLWGRLGIDRGEVMILEVMILFEDSNQIKWKFKRGGVHMKINFMCLVAM